MPYQLLFCLHSEDTGTNRNPALVPVVDHHGNIRLFSNLDEVHKTISRFRRLADGLVYYTIAMPEPVEIAFTALYSGL